MRKGYQRSCILSDSDSSTLACSESSRVQQRYTCAMIGRSWVTKKVLCVHVMWLNDAHSRNDGMTHITYGHANGKLIFIRLTFVFPCWHGLDGSHKLGLSTHVLCRFALQAKQVQVLIDTFTSSFTTSAFTLYTYFIEIQMTSQRHKIFNSSYRSARSTKLPKWNILSQMVWPRMASKV